jgi:hypothetical protein
MGFYRGPNIVRDGLVFAIDAGSERSYSGSGTSVSSLIGTSTGTLVNGTTFNSDNGGSFSFDGTNDHIDMGTGLLSLQNSSFSLETFIKWDGGSQDTFFGYHDGGAAKKSIHWRIYSNGMLRFDFYSSSINSPAGSIIPNEWNHLILTFNYSTSKCICYKNGNVLNYGYIGPYLGDDAISTAKIGMWTSTENYGGKIPMFRAYNRELTESEVLQNYNAQKNRFM